jgi:hypothetical protein
MANNEIKNYDGKDFNIENFEQYAKDAMADLKIPGMAIGIVQDGKVIYAKGLGIKANPWVNSLAPAGGFNSNLNDMIKWLNFQLNHDELNKQRLISQENLNWIRSPHTTMDSEKSYCLGWIYHKKNNYPSAIIWHNGSTYGMSTMVALIPKKKIGIVILSNSDEYPAITRLGIKFFEQYFSDKNLTAYQENKAAVNKQESENATNKEKDKPPRPITMSSLAEYTGTYKHEAYGSINVSLSDKDKSLIAVIGSNKLKLSLVHKNDDTFIVYGSPLNFYEDLSDDMRFKFEITKNQVVLTLEDGGLEFIKNKHNDEL